MLVSSAAQPPADPLGDLRRCRFGNLCRPLAVTTHPELAAHGLADEFNAVRAAPTPLQADPNVRSKPWHKSDPSIAST